jgi:nucleotide-binding universal stress UspA family protein
MRVLVAIDDSKFSQALIAEVAARSWQDGTQMMVLNVVAIPTEQHWQDWGLGVDAELIQVLRGSAQSLVENTVKQLRSQLDLGIEISGKVAEGHAAECILGAAKAWHADLIMVGANGAGWLPQFILGSVAQRVLMGASCTVEIIRERKAEQEKTKSAVA